MKHAVTYQLIKKDGKYAVQVGNATIVVSEDKQERLKAHNIGEQDIQIGVRPEHITLGEVEGGTITGEVEVSEMMGSSVHLHMNALGRDCIVIVPTLDLADNSLDIGSTVKFTFAPNAVHMFDPATGKNLEYLD